MAKPDTITVTVTRSDQITADKVDILATLKDSSLVTGSAALARVSGLNQLVSALHGVGVKDEHIALLRIRAHGSGGILDSVSTTNYQVRVRCTDLEALVRVLGAITTQRHTTLDGLVWGFPDDKRLRNRWLRACLAEANEKAALIASGLGVALLGVHNLKETWKDADVQPAGRSGDVSAAEATAQFRPQAIELGITLAQAKSLEFTLEVEFRVAEFQKDGSE